MIVSSSKREQRSTFQMADRITIFLYVVMVLLGWLNIYAAVYDIEKKQIIFDLTINSGKQFLWICSSTILIFIIMFSDYKIYDALAYFVYSVVILLLVLVLFLGREIAGSRSWFDFGFLRLQPAEFAKLGVSLAIAKYLSEPNIKVEKYKTLLILLAFIMVPVLLIIKQGDTGTALVFAAFVLVLYREGMSRGLMLLGILLVLLFISTLFLKNYIDWLVAGIVLVGLLILFFIEKKRKKVIFTIIGTALAVSLVLSVNFFITKVLKPHQQKRIDVLVNPNIDPLGVGWQVTQSKIAIGSGGFLGKGFLKGTQTKFDFVPDQSTDFIFCTVGEEHGWVGSMIVIGLFVSLLYRLIVLAERQKSRFARVYIYCVMSLFLFHFMINIGMTIGLFPVIGIPLPFFSYGGSSLWSFSILLFIAIKLDAHRMQILGAR
ncbi:MAG: rod shape-determining protein RodA [Cytophagales bacterium]|nr:rod shape-determining protein RodA [Cytophagales bacterium]MDW8383798.1 rod shape-determining protein RodA [Flammeovirgaceae bacterium]